MSCLHEDFEATVTVKRITPSDEDSRVIAYAAEIRVECHECHEPFAFIGPPVGLLPNEPTISVDALELRVPLRPSSDPAFHGRLTGFTVNFKQQRLARERSDA